MFRGEIGNFNLPVVNVKKKNFVAKHREISPRKSDFRGEKINFPLAGEISRWFRREKSQVISANCAKLGF